MKIISVLVAMAVILFPASSFADCPDYHPDGVGPQSPVCSGAYYTFDTSCASASGDVTTTTTSCSRPGYQFTTGIGDVDYQMTVPYNHGSSCKDVSIYVDYSDPNSYPSNGITAAVRVWHNGTVAYYNTFLQHGGSQGSMSCDLVTNGPFSAAAGDTIEVDIWSNNYTGATMKVSAPIIWD